MLRFFSTLRSKLFSSFFAFVLLTAFVAVLSIWFYQKREDLGTVLGYIEDISGNLNKVLKYEREFFTHDITEPGFYQTGSSEYLARHEQGVEDLKVTFKNLEDFGETKSFGIDKDLDTLKIDIISYESFFRTIVKKENTLGYKEFGLAGKVQNYAGQLEQNKSYFPNREKLLLLRQYEKDYLLHSDSSSVNALKEIYEQIRSDIKNRPSSEKNTEIQVLLTEYINSFMELVTLKKEVGHKYTSGLRKELVESTTKIENKLAQIRSKAYQDGRDLQETFYITFVIVLITSVIVSLIMSYLLTQQMIKPVSRLSTHINSIVESQFTGEITPLAVESEDEVGRLTRNFNLMTEEIQQHLQETTKKSKVLQKQNMQLQSINLRLISSENKLRSLNSVKDKFFSIISHDLKGPLHTLTGFLQILIKYTNTFTEAELREFAESMDNSVKRLLTMLENLLQWSRSQTGSIEHKPITLKLNNVLQENLHLFTDIAKNKDISLVLESDTNIWVKADKNMLDFIMRNLISNAIKFTRQGGQVKVIANSSISFTEITVSDNGVGISPEDMKKLFQPDVHFSTPGTGKEKGTGFGLLLCKDFVEKNGGEISIESIPGRGTSLKFTVPNTEEHPEMVEEQ
jgi:signal transduction histidine kinase